MFIMCLCTYMHTMSHYCTPYSFTSFLFVAKDMESNPDSEFYMDDEGEGETTAMEESTVVDDPTLNAEQTDRSAPPTRQKDGQPLEPLHEV